MSVSAWRGAACYGRPPAASSAVPIRSQWPSDSDLSADLERINRKLQRYLEMWEQFSPLLDAALPPVAVVAETDDAYIVKVELGDVGDDAVDVTLINGMLNVRIAKATRRTDSGPEPNLTRR